MSEPASLQIPSMKPHCSAAQWRARVDLAACYRLVDLYGVSDMMANDISVRVPDEPDAFLINAYGMMDEEITASSLVKVDLAGNIPAKPGFVAVHRRRSSVKIVAIVALLIGSLLARDALAQAWPAKAVRVVVAFTAGGTTDILGRNIGQQLSDKLGQQFVIDNRPGAGGNLGTELVVRAPADGYTLIIDSVGPIAVNPTLYKKLPYNPLTDLVPIVQIAEVPNVLIVHPSVPAKDFDAFIAYARAHPGKLNYASTGIGTSAHLSGFVLAKRAGIEATHVPYKGADALRDLLAGRVQFMFATIPSVIQHINSGALRAIAVSSAKRSRSLPDVPTVAERGFPGFEAGSWFGFFGPKGTPPEVIATLNKAVNEILDVPATQAQLIREGADPAGGSPQDFAQFVQREYEKWRVVVRESGATAD